MSDYKILSHDLCMSDPAPFNQHWEARVVGDVNQMDVGLALQACLSRLRPGDLVNVTSFLKNDWRVVTQVASFRVVGVSHVARVVQVGDVVEVPAQTVQEAKAESMRLTVVPIGGCFVVKDEHGNELETFVEKAQADAFKDREEGRAAPVVATSEPKKPTKKSKAA